MDFCFGVNPNKRNNPDHDALMPAVAALEIELRKIETIEDPSQKIVELARFLKSNKNLHYSLPPSRDLFMPIFIGTLATSATVMAVGMVANLAPLIMFGPFGVATGTALSGMFAGLRKENINHETYWKTINNASGSLHQIETAPENVAKIISSPYFAQALECRPHLSTAFTPASVRHIETPATQDDSHKFLIPKGDLDFKKQQHAIKI